MVSAKKYTAFLLVFFCVGVVCAQRRVIDFNYGWKFRLGNDSAAFAAAYNDASWRVLDVPHDWSIEGSFDEKHPATNQGGSLPGGFGWYRKKFVLPAGLAGKQVAIEFDGIYRNSEVWINGHYLGKRPNGYISFGYDLTPYLQKPNVANVIAVKVDNSQQPNSRWYTGSGIYRNVRVVVTDRVAVDQWGSYVTTPVITKQAASVRVALQLRRVGQQAPYVEVITKIIDAKGRVVAEKGLKDVVLHDSLQAVVVPLQVAAPQLWSVNRPYLYRAVTSIVQGGKVIDKYATTFGVRYFRFDADKGFFLNDEPLKILGVCMHHDLGALGAAVNVRAMERQLEIMKAMGANAIRTAHNPPAPELLDLCDRMGLLVIDEAFDMWRKKKNKFDYYADFPEWHRRDLEDQVKRDRNHPSVFLWSIGNEIREQFDSTGITLTRELVDIVKALDTTRPVIAALSEWNPAKNFMYQSGVFDVVGLNYHHEVYADFQKHYPGKAFLATENMSALATRGHYDLPSDTMKFWPQKSPMKYVEGGNADLTVSAFDQVAAYWGSTHETTWKIIKKHPFLSGLFVWTGFDYLGEPVPYPWPARSSYYGIVDLAGFPKDVYYLYQSEWTNKPVLHVFPHWNWQPGQVVDVWAYYNQADEVELFLNGRSLGVQRKNGDDLHVMWRVPFEAGELRAVSRRGGETVLEKTIKTAGKAFRLELIPDRKIIHADGKDLSFITIRILDEKGSIVQDADPSIKVNLTGNGSLAAMDNGYQASLESFKGKEHKAYHGLCLAIIQSGRVGGDITIEATAAGLQGGSVTIRSVKK
ncbi:glycoside hydrolase family 2 TIM barrel-domain containing protein [Paraflavitalea sp. CAU 1676]|uniref:glycoside hydrolase family 2 TIM barrel-domain containing protein n=1 Tax=Paraflavitalea sp. CAU 1676 TaxID=3032598 RepID=UPI0023DA26A6|nr:glycoside hydrolase family 2 TIM barrel-domain containing protein [Paraflavitalea sp. CAU 1676]MDF2190436.1 glycoside hydrolase family 2 TIM barrel-domain containing protein [Paraflavitalea sp. CAU 1676]